MADNPNPPVTIPPVAPSPAASSGISADVINAVSGNRGTIDPAEAVRLANARIANYKPVGKPTLPHGD